MTPSFPKAVSGPQFESDFKSHRRAPLPSSPTRTTTYSPFFTSSTTTPKLSKPPFAKNSLFPFFIVSARSDQATPLSPSICFCFRRVCLLFHINKSNSRRRPFPLPQLPTSEGRNPNPHSPAPPPQANSGAPKTRHSDHSQRAFA